MKRNLTCKNKRQILIDNEKILQKKLQHQGLVFVDGLGWVEQLLEVMHRQSSVKTFNISVGNIELSHSGNHALQSSGNG